MSVVVDSKARFDETAQVVVIGAGGAGSVAALAARGAGADVLVLDRDAAPSGATACSSGMVPAAGTAEQKARGIADSPQRFADDIQAKANGCADGPLVEALTNASAKVLEWLTQKYGIRFELVEGIAPGHSLSRMHALADRGGATLLSSLYSALGNQRCATRAGSTRHRSDRRRLSARHRRAIPAQRQVESVGCDVLILACNGFAANSSLVAQYLPDVRALPFAGHDGSQGDALAWGWHSGRSSRTSWLFGARSGDPVSTVAAAVVADDRRAVRSIATVSGSSTSMRVTRNPLCSFSRNPARRRS